ncbi:quijote [Carabus blaptoides fortunei]
METLKNRKDNLVKSAISSIALTARLCKKVLDEKDLPDKLEELSKHVKKYCELDINYDIHAKALQQTEDFYKDLEDENNDSFDAKFKHFYDKEKVTHKNSINTHPYMVEYIASRFENEECEKNSDEDTDERFTPPVDPITKAPIRNPVRNTKCGHVYENDSIRTLIAKKNTRCPYIGCPALQYIQIDHLTVEENLKRKIDAYMLEN